MADIKFINGNPVPLEMHKVRVVQKLELLSVDERVEKNKQAGNNAHLLKNEDVFLDMLTDSGTNAMSDRQIAAMMLADDAYAGSASYYRLEDKIKEIFGVEYFLPAHQGRACEHLLAKVFVQKGMVIPMNYHFTTTKCHIEEVGAKVLEIVTDEGLKEQSDAPFKGDIDVGKLKEIIKKVGSEKIGFVRIEAGTNLIGGQPVSLDNMKEVTQICKKNGILTVLDASLLADNLYFMKVRDKQCADLSIREICAQVSKCFDIIYFSARKLTCSRGGGMCFKNKEHYLKIRDLIPMYEGFATYGGISVREIEAMAVGLEETMDFEMISQGPLFIEEMVKQLERNNVPVVTPAGGLGVHLDCKKFVPHVPQNQYPGCAVHSALYIASGIRGTERGTLSEQRDEEGNEVLARLELLRLALPRRVFTLSQIQYAVDRITWLYQNRDLIGGLKFVEEPKVLRFFFGRLEPIGNWQTELVKKFKQDFGDSL